MKPTLASDSRPHWNTTYRLRTRMTSTSRVLTKNCSLPKKLNTSGLRLSEQALGPEEQHGDDDQHRHRLPEHAGDVDSRVHLSEAQHETADHRATDRAHAAEDHHRERDEQEGGAGRVGNLRGID